MTFEMFGAGCFGAVIGFVAWRVVRAGEASLDAKQLAALVGALVGAAILSAFPAGTTLFAAYSSGLALGFFLVPLSRILASALSSISHGFNPPQLGSSSEVQDHLTYIEQHWPEIENVVASALRHNNGRIHAWQLLALPLDEAGRVSVLRRYARTYPDRVSFGGGFGWTLRLRDPHSTTGEGDG
jgi:hypothetical protein